MDIAAAIPLIIPRPLVHAMADGGRCRMAATRALPCIGVQECAVPWHMLSHQAGAGPYVRLIADPETRLTRLPCDDADHGGTIIRIGAMSLALMGASTRWPVVAACSR
jgi:hypothetical protein